MNLLFVREDVHNNYTEKKVELEIDYLQISEKD